LKEFCYNSDSLEDVDRLGRTKIMSKAVEARRSQYSPELLAKVQELALMMGAEKYGERVWSKYSADH
jgi:hypothetical protein